jgi:hypothetical protein
MGELDVKHCNEADILCMARVGACVGAVRCGWVLCNE